MNCRNLDEFYKKKFDHLPIYIWKFQNCSKSYSGYNIKIGDAILDDFTQFLRYSVALDSLPIRKTIVLPEVTEQSVPVDLDVWEYRTWRKLVIMFEPRDCFEIMEDGTDKISFVFGRSGAENFIKALSSLAVHEEKIINTDSNERVIVWF